MELRARPLLPGSARGDVLRLARPLSFWGGVDPRTGVVTDPGSDGHGVSLADRVVLLAATRGSSSSSAILLELIVAGRAPAALVLAEIDAILAVGILVARELGRSTPPLLLLPAADQARLETGIPVAVNADGSIVTV
ncbi:MAG: DUF126 domain-containing protein [Alphaproteobacteria bacterium]|nr:DUF126 domain-containing protein [Alphaproteobacteria bacterium]